MQYMHNMQLCHIMQIMHFMHIRKISKWALPGGKARFEIVVLYDFVSSAYINRGGIYYAYWAYFLHIVHIEKGSVYIGHVI